MTQARHEALAHLALATRGGHDVAEAGVTMQALSHRPTLILRGESDDKEFLGACRAALGFDLPSVANHVADNGKVTALWLGPSEWMLLGTEISDGLKVALTNCHHALVDIGDGQQVIALTGPRADEVMAKLCPLDLDDDGMAVGRCARSVLAGVAMTLWRQPEGGYHIHVGRSFADYAWRILADAALEFGVRETIEDNRPEV